MRPRALHIIVAAAEVIAILTLFSIYKTRAEAVGLNGTTLTAYKTAEGGWLKTYSWSLSKTVTPSTWNIFQGDDGTSNFTVKAEKDGGRDFYYVTGQACVTNAGEVATNGLAIEDVIEYKTGSGIFQTLLSSPLDLSARPVLSPGESYCYPYQLVFDPVANAVYRNKIDVTILNHSGWLPGGNKCPGTAPCPFGPSPKTDFSLPINPKIENDTIHVTDSDGHTWEFSQTDSRAYSKTFTCSADAGTYHNTATIQEPGQRVASAAADVTVSCYQLTTTKTASTSYTRTYVWDVTKKADQTSIALALNQPFDIHYTVQPIARFTDSNWKTEGVVTVNNPAPVAAQLTGVKDTLSDQSAVTLDCGVIFPYTLESNQTLTCRYSSPLTSADNRVNFAVATLQNYSYTKDGSTPSSKTTDFSASTPIDFAVAAITSVDQCATITDSLQGTLGSLCYQDIVSGSSTYAYTRTVGPFATCGVRTILNDATIKGATTERTAAARWSVTANTACSVGCTLTIGYWKTHAGFGPQADMLSVLLPITLGTPGGSKTFVVDSAQKAVDILNKQTYGTSANGITKLYAQLSAAKLNIKSGAGTSPVTATITAADSFLATTSYLDWSKLTKTQQQQVLKWHDTLDQYNNGLLTVPHCSE